MPRRQCAWCKKLRRGDNYTSPLGPCLDCRNKLAAKVKRSDRAKRGTLGTDGTAQEPPASL
jgi:hypothetical protein